MNDRTTKQHISEYFSTSKELYRVRHLRIYDKTAIEIRCMWECAMEHIGNSFIGNLRWENFEQANREMYEILNSISEFVWIKETETRKYEKKQESKIKRLEQQILELKKELGK